MVTIFVWNVFENTEMVAMLTYLLHSTKPGFSSHCNNVSDRYQVSKQTSFATIVFKSCPPFFHCHILLPIYSFLLSLILVEMYSAGPPTMWILTSIYRFFTTTWMCVLCKFSENKEFLSFHTFRAKKKLSPPSPLPLHIFLTLPLILWDNKVFGITLVEITLLKLRAIRVRPRISFVKHKRRVFIKK